MSEEELAGFTVAASPQKAGELAASRAAEAILDAIESRGVARVVFVSAPSQEAMLVALGSDSRIDWGRVRSFHMDEYLDLPMDHPQAFGQWLTERLPDAARPGFHRIDSTGEADAEARRYSDLIREGRIDVTCLGIGVNGHVAFNEPQDARFDDPEVVRTVRLDPSSRHQQVDEGLFRQLRDVPTRALTLTVPALLGARVMVATVLGEHKARAVSNAITGPVTEGCPASIMRTHHAAFVYVDTAAASLLIPTSEMPGGRRHGEA